MSLEGGFDLQVKTARTCGRSRVMLRICASARPPYAELETGYTLRGTTLEVVTLRGRNFKVWLLGRMFEEYSTWCCQ